MRQFKQLGVWWFECRLIQAPLAFNSGHERVLPAPPTVRRIREGSAGSETEPPVNELQALHLPPDFRGTYFLRWNYRVSKLLGIEDGPDEIAGALNAMFESGSASPASDPFEVTNPEPDNAYIEFVGELAGSSQPLITVEVNTFAPGVLTFTLPLDRAEMAAALRSVAEIEVPFEVEVEIVEDGEDIDDPAVPGRLITLFQQAAKVVREQIWDEMATVQPIDWLRPPQPRDYIPFTPDQIIVGVQHYVAVFGDGEARSFSFPHNLGTEAFHLTVRANVSGGRVLVNGEDFTITIPSANEAVLEFPIGLPAPALNSLALVLSTAGPQSAFLAHTHTMEQVIGLLEAIAALSGRVDLIEELLPHVTPGLLTTKVRAYEITIPDKSEAFPARLGSQSNVDPAKLKPGGLLPAVHDATVAPLVIPLGDAAANAGNVFHNETGWGVTIPGGLGRRSSILQPDGYAASDGRVWYRVTRDGLTNSFYPADFERELFMLHINEQQFRAGGTFTAEFDLEVQLFNAVTRGQYLLVVEAGTAHGQTTPAPVGTNLQDVVWMPAPVLSQRIIVTGLKLTHHFGCAFRRSLDGLSITADRLIYDVWQGGAPPPESPSFALRARLIQFDTENSVAGAKGLVFYRLSGAKAGIRNT